MKPSREIVRPIPRSTAAGKRGRRTTAAPRNGTVRSRASKRLPGLAEWEAMKARRRNISPAEAVRECSFLSMQYRRLEALMPDSLVDVDRIIEALNARKVPFVLTGTHGIGTWTGRPRATKDVDILSRLAGTMPVP